MNNKVYPCLWFDRNGKQAAELYCEVFTGGNILADTGLVQLFEIAGKKFMALNGGPHFKINPSISFFLSCQSKEELDEKWKKLSEGGMVMMPLNKYPWSEYYGWCQDRFGVNWQLMMGGTMGEESIVPCLMFTGEKSGKAEEAIERYISVFKNASVKALHRYEENEPDVTGYIKHGQFFLEGQLFTAMDSSGPHPFGFNEGLSFVVDCDGQEEVDYYWSQLTANGGTESRCGWLKDPFGISWQIVPQQLPRFMSDPDKEKAGRVMQAMLKMNKIIIADLQDAYDGRNQS